MFNLVVACLSFGSFFFGFVHGGGGGGSRQLQWWFGSWVWMLWVRWWVWRHGASGGFGWRGLGGGCMVG